MGDSGGFTQVHFLRMNQVPFEIWNGAYVFEIAALAWSAPYIARDYILISLRLRWSD